MCIRVRVNQTSGKHACIFTCDETAVHNAVVDGCGAVGDRMIVCRDRQVLLFDREGRRIGRGQFIVAVAKRCRRSRIRTDVRLVARHRDRAGVAVDQTRCFRRRALRRAGVGKRRAAPSKPYFLLNDRQRAFHVGDCIVARAEPDNVDVVRTDVAVASVRETIGRATREDALVFTRDKTAVRHAVPDRRVTVGDRVVLRRDRQVFLLDIKPFLVRFGEFVIAVSKRCRRRRIRTDVRFSARHRDRASVAVDKSRRRSRRALRRTGIGKRGRTPSKSHFLLNDRQRAFRVADRVVTRAETGHCDVVRADVAVLRVGIGIGRAAREDARRFTRNETAVRYAAVCGSGTVRDRIVIRRDRQSFLGDAEPFRRGPVEVARARNRQGVASRIFAGVVGRRERRRKSVDHDGRDRLRLRAAVVGKPRSERDRRTRNALGRDGEGLADAVTRRRQTVVAVADRGNRKGKGADVNVVFPTC